VNEGLPSGIRRAVKSILHQIRFPAPMGDNTNQDSLVPSCLAFPFSCCRLYLLFLGNKGVVVSCDLTHFMLCFYLQTEEAIRGKKGRVKNHGR